MGLPKHPFSRFRADPFFRVDFTPPSRLETAMWIRVSVALGRLALRGGRAISRTREEQSMKLANLEKAYQLKPHLRGKVKILMDTKGPEIRTGQFAVYNSKKEMQTN